MSEERPVQADIGKALKALAPLAESRELPAVYLRQLRGLMRRLELLGAELKRREEGAAQAKKQGSGKTLLPKEGADGDQGA